MNGNKAGNKPSRTNKQPTEDKTNDRTNDQQNKRNLETLTEQSKQEKTTNKDSTIFKSFLSMKEKATATDGDYIKQKQNKIKKNTIHYTCVSLLYGWLAILPQSKRSNPR
jgi:hypothetical protein